MPWIPRGLREGIVTTKYPRRPDGYGPGFLGSIVVQPGPYDPRALRIARESCPTNAISVTEGVPRLDHGSCILCGRCAKLAPETFGYSEGFETSERRRSALVVPHLDEDPGALESARSELARRARALRRSVHVRHVDAGSDGAEEWEIAALTNPIYDVQRLGIFFTASPRHADLLLVTGVGAVGMADSLRQTFDALPDPKVVVAAGVDAISGGIIGEGYASRGGVMAAVPVDVFVPGSPPTPFGLLYGILLAVGLLPKSPEREPPMGQPDGTQGGRNA